MAEVLVGRSGELALIGAFVERARTGGGTLLLFGERAPVRRHLLYAAASAVAEAGTLVLRAAGVEFEVDLTFSGLHQALLPLLDVFGQLSVAHRDALNVALGYGAGPPPDRLLVSTATLTVLRQAAASSPVLLIVDDLPWLDRASAGVFGFGARRVAGSRVGFLAASRTGQESFFERAGLAQHELGPLDEKAATGLVSSRFPELAPRVLRRVLAEAQGNPLALLELPAALSRAQRAAAEALPAVLPLSRRLQGLFASRASALPAPARWLLLLAVLDGTGDLRVLQAAAGPQQIEEARADQPARDSLTPQERQIAMLAAAGLTNKEIGQQLFLSHRTVGAHLYQIFPKLGITTHGRRCATRSHPSLATVDLAERGDRSVAGRPGHVGQQGRGPRPHAAR